MLPNAATGLNPRFDGAFLNFKKVRNVMLDPRLNPRFDGAFLNLRVWLMDGISARS